MAKAPMVAILQGRIHPFNRFARDWVCGWPTRICLSTFLAKKGEGVTGLAFPSRFQRSSCSSAFMGVNNSTPRIPEGCARFIAFAISVHNRYAPGGKNQKLRWWKPPGVAWKRNAPRKGRDEGESTIPPPLLGRIGIGGEMSGGLPPPANFHKPIGLMR